MKAATWTEAGITDFGLEELLKYKINPPFFSNTALMIMNLDKWNGFTDKEREIFEEAFAYTQEQAVNVYGEYIANELKVLEENGVEIVDLGEEFSKLASDAGWEDFLNLNPETGPKLQELYRK